MRISNFRLKNAIKNSILPTLKIQLNQQPILFFAILFINLNFLLNVKLYFLTYNHIVMYYNIFNKLVNLYYWPLCIRKFLANSDTPPPFSIPTICSILATLTRDGILASRQNNYFCKHFATSCGGGGGFSTHFLEGGRGLYITRDEAS